MTHAKATTGPASPINLKDGLRRCAWCVGDELYERYHDQEWGVPCFDDRQLFAMLCLEGMQAGLSWITILRKRQAYYDAFDGFDPVKIAQYDEQKVDMLMQNVGIVRHRQKIQAIITNAQAYLNITKNQSFSEYLWSMARRYQAVAPQINRWQNVAQIPAQTQASILMSKQLKKDGFKFVGATTCYAFMQACGMVNDHVADCAFAEG